MERLRAISKVDLCVALHEAIKADHGFNVESAAIRDLIEIMATYDKNGRRDFLQFITGSPKLPIGGQSLLALTALVTDAGCS